MKHHRQDLWRGLGAWGAASLLALAWGSSTAAADTGTAAEPALQIEVGQPDAELAAPPPAAPAPRAAAGATGEPTSIAIEIGGPAERPPRDDEASDAGAVEEEGEETILHGFRLGYLYLHDYDVPVDPSDPDSSLQREHGLRSPHQFLIGYEVADRITGSGWLNILLVGNVMLSGLEQSKLLPSANMLLGFEFDQSFQAGVGVNLVPVRDKPAHMVLAAGWTPRMGEMYLPLHFFFIPDVDHNHRLGVTVGVNWAT